MDKRKLKHFDSPTFNEKLRQAKESILTAQDVRKALIKFNCDTLEDVKKYLYKSTGFDNYMFSAEALNLRDEYITLSIYLDKIDFTNYNEDCTDLIPEYEANLRELHSTYWSVEDTKQIEEIQAHINTLNEFSLHGSISVDRYGKLNFNEISWDQNRQLHNLALRRQKTTT